MRMTAAGVVGALCLAMTPVLTQPVRLWHSLGCSFQQSGRGKSHIHLPCLKMNLCSVRLCPVDAILTRMGAYDNMFSNASTFKVELDEWCVAPAHRIH
jgi:hypothetical protein